MAEHNFSVENTLTLLLDDKKYHSLRDILSTMNPADIAAVFDELPESTASASVPPASQGAGGGDVRRNGYRTRRRF